MAYGDYKTQAQLRGTVVPGTATGSPDGLPAQWIHNGESAEQTITNRPADALAANMDNLKLPLDAMIAVTEMYLYFGTSAYVGQEGWDSLFQLTDSDYNEVLVDGAEVKITSVAPGPFLGTGFNNSSVFTVTLSDTIPAGDYRLRFARNATLATLPEDALISADIRGVHESAGEAARVSYAVCDASAGAERLADYVGATALEDALAAGEKAIFLRQGNYGPYNSLIFNNCVVMGENGSTVVRMNATGANGAISLNNAQLYNFDFNPEVTPTESAAVFTVNDECTVRNVRFRGWQLWLAGERITIENVECGGQPGCVLSTSLSKRVSVKNLLYDTQNLGSSSVVVDINGSEAAYENIFPFTPGSNLGESYALRMFTAGAHDVSFKNCRFETGDGTALYFSQDGYNVSFENCQFRANETLVSMYTTFGAATRRTAAFRSCKFINTATTWHSYPVAKIGARRHPTGDLLTVEESGIWMEHCYFYDRWARGHTNANDPGTTPIDDVGNTGDPVPIMELFGVHGRDIVFDRGLITRIVQDNEWVLVYNSVIDGFQVINYNGSTAPEPYRYEAANQSSGLVIIQQSKVSNVYVSLHCIYDNTAGGPPYHQGRLEYPYGIVAVLGLSTSSTTDRSPCAPTVVDGVQIWCHGNGDGGPYIPSGGAIGLGTNCHVSGFTWNRGSLLFDGIGGSGTRCIVMINGDGAIFDKWKIDVENASSDVDVSNIFYVDSCDSWTIRDGRCYVTQDTLVNRPNRCIYLNGNAQAGLVDGNIWVWNDQQNIDFPMFDFDGTVVGSNQASFIKFVHNHVYINGSVPDSGSPTSGKYNVVSFWLEGIAIGNSFHNDAASGLGMEINPNTVTGYSTNIFRRNEQPDRPNYN
jgi:hypothetical protein